MVAYSGDIEESTCLRVKHAATERVGFWQSQLFDEELEPQWVEADTKHIRMERVQDFGGYWILLNEGVRVMRIRSPRLGETELNGQLKGLKIQGDHLIMSMSLSEPATWQVRASLTHKDLTRLIWWFVRSRVPLFLLTGFRSRKNPRPPDEFITKPDLKSES